MTTNENDHTWHVEPGGPPLTRTLSHLAISKISVGPMDNNAYLLVCRASNDALLIDAANDTNRLLALLAAQRPAVRLTGVVTTHRHADHWQALAAVIAATGVPALAGAPDAADLPVPVDRPLAHGDVVSVGTNALEIIALRGHTPGSIALLYRDPDGSPHLFTGDSLFPGGPGKTATPADFASLMDDLERRVFAALPDETRVHPGHGDGTTLGSERPRLGEWRARGW
jgi:glyoxylase-like metal-dependent hydrolase (beta-lactamase superfamily II)